MLIIEVRLITTDLLSGKSNDGASEEFDKDFSLRWTVSLWRVVISVLVLVQRRQPGVPAMLLPECPLGSLLF